VVKGTMTNGALTRRIRFARGRWLIRAHIANVISEITLANDIRKSPDGGLLIHVAIERGDR
jgi:hypothetical protein